MAARLTRARKRLARESFDLPTGSRPRRPPGAGRRRRLPRLHRRVRAGLGVRRAPAGRGRRGDPAGAGAARGRARGTPWCELDSLLALMLLQHSRRDARVDDGGGLVLLPDQDRRRWHAEEIAEALALLTPWAHAPGTPYLLQALIAAEHAVAPSAAGTDWSRIARHYRELEDLTGSPVVRLNRAVAVAEADGPQAGLALLDGLELAGHRLPARARPAAAAPRPRRGGPRRAAARARGVRQRGRARQPAATARRAVRRRRSGPRGRRPAGPSDSSSDGRHAR